MEGIQYPFKFNHVWLEDVEFEDFIKDQWDLLEDVERESPMKSLTVKLKKLKSVVSKWERTKYKRLKEDLFRIEGESENIYHRSRDGVLLVFNRHKAVDLESRKLHILTKEEERWRQKGSAIWLAKGDLNTKVFHNYVDYRRRTNALWDIFGMEGWLIKGQEDLNKEEKKHLKYL